MPKPPQPGWSRTLRGHRLDYHSAYPDVRRALVCRAKGDAMAITWQTAPAITTPTNQAISPTTTFRWLAALATAKGAHLFTLAVDGDPCLHFRTDGAHSWRVAARNGLVLSFTTTMVDHFGELFGYMDLEVPSARVRPGQPLELTLAGEDAGCDDWCLIHEHALVESVTARAECALTRPAPGTGQGPRQPIRLEFSRLGPPTAVTVKVDNEPAIQTVLSSGYQELRITTPPVAAPTTSTLSITFADDTPPSTLTINRTPVTPRELWLLPHPHLDIGYTDLQDAVERRHWDHLEQALALARQTRGHPPEARFRWNVEQLWAVETWWRQATSEQREQLVDAARSGEVGLQALLAGVLTGICHPHELDHLTDFARELAAATGLVIDTAMITDIPGQTWTLVPALARAGVRYLSSGPNYMPGHADGGDRIGGVMRAWGDRPFWWRSQRGDERLLFWMTGRGYSWFHGLGGALLDPERPRAVMDYLHELNVRAYPYGMVQVRYTIGGDNGPPDPDLPDRVRAWNDHFQTPTLHIATASAMFAEFERRHGAQLPTLSGDLTPYWEDGAASSARETAQNRASANRLVQAEALWSMVDPAERPTHERREAWRQVVLFSEHTWGSAESISAPDAPHVQAQWAYKRNLAESADLASRALVDHALARLARDAAPEDIVVYNTLDHAHGEVVTVTTTTTTAATDGDQVLDDHGAPVPSQRLADGRLAFLATAVPGPGRRRYRLEQGAAAPPEAEPATADGLVLQNAHLRAEVDPVTGAVRSLIWRARGLELVDTAVWPGLNAYLYVPGQDPALAVGPREVTVRTLERGPLVASLLIESEAPGARSLSRELRLTATGDRLDIVDVLDKLPVRAKESVHLAFPLRVPGAQLRVDLGGTLIRPDHDQLEGSCRDWFCVHSGVELVGADLAVAWVTRDAPLVEIGALTDERPGPGGTRTWRPQVGAGATLFSYVMNNHWHTNYRAEQEGPVTLRYSIRVGPPGSCDLTAFGRQVTQPLLTAAGHARM